VSGIARTAPGIWPRARRYYVHPLGGVPGARGISTKPSGCAYPAVGVEVYSPNATGWIGSTVGGALRWGSHIYPLHYTVAGRGAVPAVDTGATGFPSGKDWRNDRL
jgi:hypothetical protein